MDKNKTSDALKDKSHPNYIGGQAVMEGVMMRGKTMYALAVRNPEKKISIDRHEFKTPPNWFKKLPVVRGIVSFVDSLFMGTKLIYKSAEMAGLDDFEEENPTKFDKFLERVFGEKLFDFIMILSVVLAIALGIGVFMLLPTLLSQPLNSVFGGNPRMLSVFEGIFRLLIFFAYILLISRMKEIKRVFQYHGAEHKTINCYESGEELTPENAAKHSRLHKRCGTSFLLIVMVVSMIFFFFFTTTNIWFRLGTRIIFVPLIAGISYEFIRLAGRSNNPIVTALSYPGLMMQKFTTFEPDLDQLEVAIAAMKTVLFYELSEGEPYVEKQEESAENGLPSEPEEVGEVLD